MKYGVRFLRPVLRVFNDTYRASCGKVIKAFVYLHHSACNGAYAVDGKMQMGIFRVLVCAVYNLMPVKPDLMNENPGRFMELLGRRRFMPLPRQYPMIKGLA
ncbi:hypothetical protein V6C16_02345 [Desulfovibrio sp. 1188_IL3213]